LLHEPALELPIAAGPLPLCHADDHRRLPGLEARVGLIGFANGRAQHARELRGAAPRLLERNLAADDPLAGRIDEASFLEIVDAAADRRASRSGRQADRGDHSRADYREGGTAHAPSSSSVLRARSTAAAVLE